MFCGKCGSELNDGAQFCQKCGARVLSGDDSAEPSAQAAAAAATSGQADGPAQLRKRRRGAVVAAVVVVALAAAAVGTGLWWKSDQDAKAAAQAAWDRAHTSHLTKVEADAPGFDNDATAIPVKVEGTDLDGNAVNEIQYLRTGSMYVTTLQGSYDLVFTGGYFTSDGKVVRAPEAVRHVEIWDGPGGGAKSGDGNSEGAGEGGAGNGDGSAGDGDGEGSGGAGDPGNGGGEGGGNVVEPEGGSGEGIGNGPVDGSGESPNPDGEDSSGADSPDSSPDGGQAPDAGGDASAVIEVDVSQGEGVVPVGSYTEVPDLEVSEELIASISALAKDDPSDGGRAEQLAQLANQNHAAAVAAEEERIRAEEEARRAAEQAAREAIPAGNYSFVASQGGYRGAFEISGGSAKLTQWQAYHPADKMEYLFTLQKTGDVAPNGNVVYRLVPVDGNSYAGPDTLYYDPARGGIIYSSDVYTGP